MGRVNLDDGGHAWFEPLALGKGGVHDLALSTIWNRYKSVLGLGNGRQALIMTMEAWFEPPPTHLLGS